MRPKGFLVLLTSLCLICVPVAPGATPSVVGKMTATGTVGVNGMRMPAEVTLFGGDRVATERDTTATLTLAGGGRLILPGLSRVQLRLEGSQLVIVLERGAVAVRNRLTNPVAMDAGGVRIESGQGGASAFEVALSGKELRVLTHRGITRVRSAERTVEVKEGMLLNATLAPEPQGPTGAGSLTAFQTFAVAVAIAAGVTGLALGVAALTRSDPEDCRAVSPSFTVVCD